MVTLSGAALVWTLLGVGAVIGLLICAAVVFVAYKLGELD
jgi:hypothetical protein